MLPCLGCNKDLHRSDFGFTAAESVRLRWDQVLVNLYINPKLIFMTLSPSIYLISAASMRAWQVVSLSSSPQKKTITQPQDKISKIPLVTFWH